MKTHAPPSSRIPHLKATDRSTPARMWLLFACSVVLAIGFIFATRNHIAAIDYGYKGEVLRREQTRLLDEQKQLQLALSQITAPQRLEQSARRVGLVPARALQLKK